MKTFKNICIILAAIFLFTIFPFMIPYCFFRYRRPKKPKVVKAWQPKIDKNARVVQSDAYWEKQLKRIKL